MMGIPSPFIISWLTKNIFLFTKYRYYLYNSNKYIWPYYPKSSHVNLHIQSDVNQIEYNRNPAIYVDVTIG